MKEPKRAKKALEYVEDIEFLLDYFMGRIRPEDKNKIKYLKDYISEISQSKKLTEIKIAEKIRKENE